MRGFALGLSISIAFIAGCVASSSRIGLSQAKATAVIEQRWAYFCFDATSTEDLNYKANAAGLRGWEMVSGNGPTDKGSTWCFRQPRP